MLDLWGYLNLNPWHLDHKDISQGQQTWAHVEHNKCGLSVIKLISPSQIINKTTGDKFKMFAISPTPSQPNHSHYFKPYSRKMHKLNVVGKPPT
jgi:hypothetical protein